MSRTFNFRAWDSEKKIMVTDRPWILAPTSPSWGAFNLHDSDEINDLLNNFEKAKFPDEPLAGCNCNSVFDWSDYYGLNHYEILQLTGLKDTNGVEICEGDVVKWDDCSGGKYWRVAVVEVSVTKGVGFKCFDCASIANSSAHGHTFWYASFIYTDTHNHLTIIGSARQNPELFK